MPGIRLRNSHLDNDVLFARWHSVEVDNLWAESGGHLVVHFPARAGQALAEVQMFLGQTIVSPQGQSPAQEAHQVILKDNVNQGQGHMIQGQICFKVKSKCYASGDASSLMEN